MPSIQDSMNAFAGTTGLSIQDAAARLASLPLPGQVDDTDGILLTDEEKQADVSTPTERVTDGDFANWSMAWYPDSWFMYNLLTDGASPVTDWTRSTDSYAGTYAVQFNCLNDSGAGSYIGTALTGSYDTDVAEKTIQARFYAKDGVSVGTTGIGVAAFYYDGADDYEWNLTTGSWIVLGSGDNNTYENIGTDGTYTQYTSTQRTLPAGATEFWFDTLGFSTTQNDTVLIDNLEWLLDGADVATDGAFENWTEYANQAAPLTSHTAVAGSNGWAIDPLDITEYSYINRSTSVQGGTYAVEMYLKASDTGNGNRGYFRQTITRPAGTSIDLSVYTKTTDSQTGYMMCLDGAPGAQTQEWDFVANTWDTQGSTVTDMPGTSNALTLSGTTSYVENTETVTVPASGTLVVVLMSDAGGGTGYTYYFDTLSAIETVVTPATPVDIGIISNPSDGSLIDADDTVFQVKTTGGTPKNFIKQRWSRCLDNRL
jgi:hypothetical protein